MHNIQYSYCRSCHAQTACIHVVAAVSSLRVTTQSMLMLFCVCNLHFIKQRLRQTLKLRLTM